MIATLATEEFRRRQAKAGDLIAAQRMTYAEANEALRPWAAIAIAAGAEPKSLAPDLGNLHRFWLTLHKDPWARACCGEEVFPGALIADVIAKARDAAMDRGKGGDLQAIADWWGRVPRYVPRHLREAAQADPEARKAA